MSQPNDLSRSLAALERDSDDALALAISGHVQAYLLRDYRKATSLLDQAISAGPSSAMVSSSCSTTITVLPLSRSFCSWLMCRYMGALVSYRSLLPIVSDNLPVRLCESDDRS